MISIEKVKKFCKDYTKIENYEAAVKDTSQTWVCHHILGEILTREQLLNHDFYYDIPPCMLKFVTRGEHNRLHNAGKHHSEEHRRKISESHKGRTFSEEHRRKISEANKGRTSPRKGVTLSEETRRKMSEAHQNISDDTRRKMSESHKGKHLSKETRRKMSEAHKRKKF